MQNLSSDRKLFAWLWDSECQDYVEISIDKNGRLFGFPNSQNDGRLAAETVLLKAVFPEEDSDEHR